MHVKRELAVPLYEQVADELRTRITVGALPAGAPLPSESAVIADFKVSRITARKALDVLLGEGLIVRRQGKGSFVAPPRIQQDLHSLKGFAELMAERGPAQAMQVVEFGVVPADARAAHALRLGAGDPVLRIGRRHDVSDKPVAFAHIYVPARFGSSFSFEEVSATPIYTLLGRKAQVEIKRATQVVRATAADAGTAKLLGVPKSAPVLMIERVTYSGHEEAVEFIVFFYRSDCYELSMELFRDPKENIMRPAHDVSGLLDKP